jgi:predicted aspartyl protease
MSIVFTVIVIVAVVAHCPVIGVKEYKVVAKLFNAGDQVPVIPLLEVVGNASKDAPEQIAVTCVNVGVIFGFTVMVIVAVEEHWPLVGANVYKVVAKLFKAGDQVPAIPFVEVVGKAAKVAPEQIAAIGVNVGFTFGFTVIVIVAFEAHCPVVGINVYKVVAILFNAGDQVPVIPLFEVVGNAAKVAPEQIAAIGVNVGVTFGFTVMVMVEIETH